MKKSIIILALIIFSAFSVSAMPINANSTVCQSFIRGDANNDNKVNILDSTSIISYFFGYGPKPKCIDAADVNDDSKIDERDYVYLLNFLYRGGSAPKFPYPNASTDEPCDKIDNDNDTIIDEGCPSKKLINISIISPKNSSVISGVVKIEAVANSFGTGISSIKLFMNGVLFNKSEFIICSGGCSGGSNSPMSCSQRCTWNWNTENEKESIASLIVKAYDTTNTLFALDSVKVFLNKSSIQVINGTINVISSPSSAKIFLNNVFVGLTDRSVTYPAGNYIIKLVKEGYKDYINNTKIEAGKTTNINAILIKESQQNGILNISSIPSGASIYLNNIFEGTTPTALSISPGNYTLKLVKEGYQNYSLFVSIDIEPNKTGNIAITLIKITEAENQTTQDGCPKLNASIKNKIKQLQNASNNVTLKEGDRIYRNSYVVLPENLLKLSQIINQTAGYSTDRVKFIEEFSGQVYDASLTAEGIGTIIVKGIVYNVNYYGASTISEEQRYGTIDFPQTKEPLKMTFYCQ